jgi:hypothetical protein
LLEVFGRHGCRGIVIGGIAAAMYGLTYETDDLDLLCAQSAGDLALLAAALTELGALVAGSTSAPRRIEPSLLSGFRILTFMTDAGDVDLLFEAAGGWRYEDLVAESVPVDLGGAEVRICSRRQLIELKRASGRPHDVRAAAELEAGQLASEVIGEVPGGEPPQAPAEPAWFADFLRNRPASGPGEDRPT